VEPKDIRNEQMTINDDALMIRFQQGDESAFRRLLERYQDRIINFISRIVGDIDTATDLGQEVFIRVYMNAGRYLPGSQFAPWLYRIASNLAINEIRRKKRWRFISLSDHSDEEDSFPQIELSDDTTPSPEEQASQLESAVIIEKALAKVPVRYRTPLVLRELEGYDYEEISEILNIPRGTVKSRLNRGRALLKNALTKLDAAKAAV
jgi:RNA polymerase sigma-70 factor, ECF subfamily